MKLWPTDSVIQKDKFKHPLLQTFVIGFAVAFIFVLGAEIQSQTLNTDLHLVDQNAYIAYAKGLAQTNYHWIGDRNRMPVYPFLMSLFYREGMADPEYFESGKRINTAITLLVIAVVFLVFRIYVSAFDALTASLVIAFTVFFYKAPYFRVEVLSYGLNFVLFVLLLELVASPRLKIAAAAGLTGGIAHLTKASALPAIALGILCLILYIISHLISSLQKRGSTHTSFPQIATNLFRPLLALVIFIVLFVTIIYPYLRTSKAIFGQYFYNVNSTFYIWYDSREEAKLGTRAHGDRVGWPDMPAEQIPGLRKYLREHTVQQIFTRFAVGGAVAAYFLAFRSDGYATFTLLYLVFLGPLIWQNRSKFTPIFLNSPSLIPAFFIASYFGGYILLNAWWYYMVMAKTSNRFILALALPLMFVVARLLSYAQSKNLSARILGQPVHSAVVNRFVLLVLLVYLVTVSTSQIILTYERNQVRDSQFVESSFTQKLRLVNPTDLPYVYAYIWNNGQTETYLLDDKSGRGSEYHIEWFITPQRIRLRGDYQEYQSAITALSADQYLAVAVAFCDAPSRATQNIFERRFRFNLTGDNRIEVVLPPEEWHNPRWPDESGWRIEDIEDVMTDAP